jgi:hypothetical protein
LKEAEGNSNGTQTWKQVLIMVGCNQLTHNKFLGTDQVTQTTTHPSTDRTKWLNSPGYVPTKTVISMTAKPAFLLLTPITNKRSQRRNNLVGEYFYDGEN